MWPPLLSNNLEYGHYFKVPVITNMCKETLSKQPSVTCGHF